MSETKLDPIQSLSTIWRELLKVEKVGADDNFFDAGGYSLLFIDLRARIAAAFDVDVSIVELLGCPTVRTQVELIGRRANTGLAAEQRRDVERTGTARSTRLLQQRRLREGRGHE